MQLSDIRKSISSRFEVVQKYLSQFNRMRNNKKIIKWQTLIEINYYSYQYEHQILFFKMSIKNQKLFIPKKSTFHSSFRVIWNFTSIIVEIFKFFQSSLYKLPTKIKIIFDILTTLLFWSLNRYIVLQYEKLILSRAF